MKKLLSILMAFCLIVIASSCNDKKDVSSQTTGNVDFSSQIINEEITQTQTSSEENTASQVANSTVTSSHKTSPTNTSSDESSSKSEWHIETTSTTFRDAEDVKLTPSATIEIIIPKNICDVRGNDLPHKWIKANCETPKTCSYCQKTDGVPLGHTLKGDGKCTTCSNLVDELVTVESPEIVMFEGYQYKIYDYSYNTETRVIDFTYYPYNEMNPEYDGLFFKANYYNNDTLISTQTIKYDGLTDWGRQYCRGKIEQNATRIVIESIG